MTEIPSGWATSYYINFTNESEVSDMFIMMVVVFYGVLMLSAQPAY